MILYDYEKKYDNNFFVVELILVNIWKTDGLRLRNHFLIGITPLTGNCLGG